MSSYLLPITSKTKNNGCSKFGVLFSLLLCLTPDVISQAKSAESATNSNSEQVTFVRLTSDQYRNTIHDIFGESIEVRGNAASNGVREAGLIAVGGRKITLSALELESYEILALDIAGQILQPSRRNTLLGCTPDDDTLADQECAEQFLVLLVCICFGVP